MIKGKKGVELITTAIIIGAILVAGVFVVPNVVAPNPNSCGESSADYRCVCGIGQVKTGFFPSWKCEDLPEIPSQITFPIETYQEARAYANSLLEGAECSGEFQFDTPLTGQISKQCGKFGGVIRTSPNKYLGHMVIVECRSLEEVDEQGRPVSGHIVFDVRFDPNDGWVYKLGCNSNLITCPENTFRSNPKDNPLPTCGDGCCHDGESFETCASDCEEIIPPECIAEEINSWISLNSYTELCQLIGGTSRTTGVSLYDEPLCDYRQKVCGVDIEGTQVEAFRWQRNIWGECGQHNLLRYNAGIVCPAI